MKKIFFVILLSMFLSGSAGASEIFGQISTNPNAPSGGQNNPPAEPPAVITPTPTAENRTGAVILPRQVNLPTVSQQTVQVEEVWADAFIPRPKGEVLGVKIYPDGALLRSGDHKIYVVRGRMKKYISSLRELEKYRGQVISNATAEELSGYQTRGHFNGELIRQVGDVKVFVINPGGKHHVLNLEELREHYFSREIFNISAEEIALY